MSKKLNITSSGLHMIAMAFMFCDHIGKTLFPTAEWLVCIGRMAFPIFAFMIVEGYFHTHSLKNYIKRIAIGAVCSEIPFNLMVGKSFFFAIPPECVLDIFDCLADNHIVRDAKNVFKGIEGDYILLHSPVGRIFC